MQQSLLAYLLLVLLGYAAGCRTAGYRTAGCRTAGCVASCIGLLVAAEHNVIR